MSVILEGESILNDGTAVFLFGIIYGMHGRLDFLHGFTEFVLLPFIHYKTELYRRGLSRPGTTWIEDLKVHAVARLFFRGFIKNIQASWVKLGPKMAQMMLNAGANDLGGTLMEEHISRAAGASYGTYMEIQEMINLIRSIGRRPAQRTTTYEIVRFF